MPPYAQPKEVTSEIAQPSQGAVMAQAALQGHANELRAPAKGPGVLEQVIQEGTKAQAAFLGSKPINFADNVRAPGVEMNPVSKEVEAVNFAAAGNIYPVAQDRAAARKDQNFDALLMTNVYA